MASGILVIVRHAHRDTSDKSADNGISDKGRQQVEKLVDLYKSGELPPADVFFSSPKRRCRETIEPLAHLAKQKVKIEALLDEQLEDETTRDMEKRVEKFLSDVLAKDKTTYLCSHGDWIPVAIKLLTGESGDLQKGQASIFYRRNAGWGCQKK